MNAVKLRDECARFSCSASAFVDGELEPTLASELEAHALACGPCAERVQMLRALRGSLRRTCRAHAPAALRAKALAALDALEVTRERAASASSERAASDRAVNERVTNAERAALGWKVAFPLAAAAGVLVAVGITAHRARLDARTAGLGAAAAPSSNDTSGLGLERGLNLESMLEELVSLHAQPLPPETTNVDELGKFEPIVGVPLRRPAFQSPFNASFRGARVHSLRDRRAALLQYVAPGEHRVTVYVFDPAKLPLKTTVLRPRMVRERPVYVGKMRGYTIAATEKSGVGYALASDLSDDQSTVMVASLQ